MKVNDYAKIIKETPTFVPVFRLNRIPEWLSAVYKVDKETLFYYDPFQGGIRAFIISVRGTLEPSCSYDIGASYLTFVEYRRIK